MSAPLSSDYEQQYESMLSGLGQGPAAEWESMSAFWPMTGHEYGGDLMVIGQVANGWEGKLDIGQLKYPEYRNRVAKRASAVAMSGICNLATRCPMLWVTDQWKDARPGHSTGRSPFWRVVRFVVDRLNLGDIERDDWPSALAWTNLYKVAPKAGGNPIQRLKTAQEPGVFELIQREIAEFAPRRVLVLTGLDWFTPFAAQVGLTLVREAGPVIEAQALDDTTHWIVVRYPARLPKGLTEEIVADQIARAFWRQGD